MDLKIKTADGGLTNKIAAGLAATIALLPIAALAAADKPSSTPPNLVIILTDDLSGDAGMRPVLDELEKRRAAWASQLVPPAFPGLMQLAPQNGTVPAPED